MIEQDDSDRLKAAVDRLRSVVEKQGVAMEGNRARLENLIDQGQRLRADIQTKLDKLETLREELYDQSDELIEIRFEIEQLLNKIKDQE